MSKSTGRVVPETGKTANKTAKPSGRNGNRLPIGAHPGNTGGKPGRSGRPSNEFRAMCRVLASSDQVERSVRKILADPNHPAFIAALKWAADRGYGKSGDYDPNAATPEDDGLTDGERLDRLVAIFRLAAARRRATRDAGRSEDTLT